MGKTPKIQIGFKKMRKKYVLSYIAYEPYCENKISTIPTDKKIKLYGHQI